ncbi:hypothetical protein KD050_14910 [Psychrobacillus sp. INOP01]|uniref:hypothetical protein n=1 Tax=Psychrobacillus sp. INOP01 TaxID=2829187 RepID=UPI001BA98B00|nr:hypothetical protein [Psychrobacillus sp. INOP01]QUG40580.1 hypothetical protein KD050_14910 [Psychrobacillus sp. INOP01]
MKKRKKLKIFLLISLVIILGAVGYLLYEFKFKTYDVADDEVSEIVEDPYVLELPDGSKITMDKDGNVVEDYSSTQTASNEGNSTTDGGSSEQIATSGQSGSTDSNETGESSGSTTSPGSSDNSPAQPTVGSIKEKYIPAFTALEGQADAKINALIGRAKTEYTSKKANGEGIDFGYFYNKYMAAAEGLEANTDTIFNGVLAAVEKDLVANGFDKSYAKSFKDEYEATKKARRDSILSKALGR